jgi:DEAD/DEAH box helicase domain-containing protein
VVTPTASGKTLCYNLPVLDRVLKDPSSRALYLFPTKALALGLSFGLGGRVTAAQIVQGWYRSSRQAAPRVAVAAQEAQRRIRAQPQDGGAMPETASPTQTRPTV